METRSRATGNTTEPADEPMVEERRTVAVCPKGLEDLLADELTALGAMEISRTKAGVYFTADLPTHYRICMHSRLANRILYWVHGFKAEDSESLYAGAKGFAWDEHVAPGGSLAVGFNGTNACLRNTHFSAQRIKDAIQDYFTQRGLARLTVDTVQPDVRINGYLHSGAVTLRLDLSGASLHRRGYRTGGGGAPLKENLAAAVLARAGWPAVSTAGGALIDPMCGSGTLLIEGLEMAMGLAPGRRRRYWGFDGWLGHVPAHWRAVVAEVAEHEAGAAAAAWPEVVGYDDSGKLLDVTRANIAAAGMAGRIRVHRKALGQLVRPTHKPFADGLIICNPPYGVRLGDAAALAPLYRLLGERLRSEFQGWRAAVFTGNPDLGKTMGLRAHKQFNFFNGTIPTKLLLFHMDERAAVKSLQARPAGLTDGQGVTPITSGEKTPASAGAVMFANRLRKNLKHLDRWRKRNDIQCYRVYDADLPEYAVAVDVYGEWFHLAEYQAPASVAPQTARRRLLEAIAGLTGELGVAADRVMVKERRKQKGKQQYGKLAGRGEFIEVKEGHATLLLNLHDYLDTGLFLDHRKVRLHIHQLARGKRFLNLFCYTGAATVHAGIGGSIFSTSVDLSGTYIDWAKRNAARNGLMVGTAAQGRHRFVRADVMSWLNEHHDQYDLIFVDPPTFSNSKGLEEHFDVQRDHGALLARAMGCLAADGLLIFSCNRRRFTLAESILNNYRVEDRSSWSLDKDFERARFSHHCWFVRHR